MRIAMTLLALSLTLSVAACKKKKTEEATPGSGTAMVASGSADTGSGSAAAGSGSADMAGSGSAAAGSGSGDMAGSGSAGGSDAEQMARAAGNCPSTVGKSTTKAEVKGKAIEITISSDDKDAINTIQRRTEELVAIKKGGGSGSGTGHDARGTHKGKVGLCPIHVPEGATIDSKKNAKGVLITITPKDGLEDLKKEIDGRITKAADWVKANVKEGEQGTSGGVGGGKGDHGGNHSGSGDGKGKERKDGTGGGAGTGGGGGKGTGGGGSGSAK